MDYVEIQDIPGKGRGLVAKADIEKGGIILVDKPYVAALDSEETLVRSFYTFQEHEPDKLMRCAGCKFARYNTKEEQAADWKEGHKEECKGLKRHAPVYPGNGVRMLARLILKRLRERSEQVDPGAQSKGPDFSTLFSQLSTPEQVGLIHRAYVVQMAASVRMLIDPKGKLTEDLDEKVIKTLLAHMAGHGCSIGNSESRPIGVGIYLLGGLINHDCRPNAVQYFTGKTMRVRALRDIHVGEEILREYMMEPMFKHNRREDLQGRYAFDIYSPEEKERLDTKEPLSKTYECLNGLITEVKIWRTCPWELDDQDQRLVEVAMRTGIGETPMAGCGLTAEIAENKWAKDLFKDAEDQLGDQLGALNPNSQDFQGPTTFPEIPRSSATYPASAIVNAWGHAFFIGNQINWGPVLRLSGYATSLSSISREGRNANAGQPLVDRGEWWHMCKEVDDLEKGIVQSSFPFVLGPLHLLRNTYTEAKFDAARKISRWEASYALGSELRPFKAFVAPVAPVGLMQLDCSMARFSMFLKKYQQACLFARSALKQLNLFCPEGSEVDEMTDIIEMATLEMGAHRNGHLGDGSMRKSA